MLIILLIFIFLIGYLLIVPFNLFNVLETLGLSFPIGLGLWSFSLFIINLVGIPINSRLLCVGLSIFLGFLVIGASHIFKSNAGFNLWANALDIFRRIRLSLSTFVWNPFYATSLLAACIIIFAICLKAQYWPIINYDSIYGYDFLAKVIAHEGSYINSIFDKSNQLYSVRSLYPPLPVHGFFIGHLFNAGHAKFIPILFLLSTMCLLYGLSLRKGHHITAVWAVLLLCLTPEFMGQSALIASNPISAFYILMAYGLFFHFMQDNRNGLLYVSLLGLSMAIWTRTEAIIFCVPMGLILLRSSEKIKRITLLVFAALIPFISWQLYLKFGIQAPKEQPILMHLQTDFEKLSRMLSQIWTMVCSTKFYAYTFILLFLSVFTNLIFFKKATQLHALSFMLILSFILYVFVYYQIDTDYIVFNKSGWIGSGFKRGVFYFIPIGCMYISYSVLTRMILLPASGFLQKEPIGNIDKQK